MSVWGAIFETFPEFEEDRMNMRMHNADINSESFDHVFLWPLMQENVLADLVRELIDVHGVNSEVSYEDRLSKLKDLEKDFRKAPWYPLILMPNDPNAEDPSNIIRSEKRSQAVKYALTLSRYLLGLTELDEAKLGKLKSDIRTLIRGELNTDEAFESYWEECLEKRII